MACKKDIYVFNVYDLDGNLICENMTSAEIAEKLGIKQSRVSVGAHKNSIIHGKYKIIINQDFHGKDKTWSEYEIEQWNEARAPFLKVEWVKERGAGVKVLRGVKS